MEENKDLKSAEKTERQCICKSKKAIYIVLGIIILGVLAVFIVPKIFTPGKQETVKANLNTDQYAADEAFTGEEIDPNVYMEHAAESIAENIPLSIEEIEKSLAEMKVKEKEYLDSLPKEISSKKFASTADKALYFGELAETYSEKIGEGTLTEKEIKFVEPITNLATMYSMEETLKYLKKQNGQE